MSLLESDIAGTMKLHRTTPASLGDEGGQKLLRIRLNQAG
jgi:hypothetical protein